MENGMNGFGDWNNRVGLAGAAAAKEWAALGKRDFCPLKAKIRTQNRRDWIPLSVHIVLVLWRESPTFAHIVPFAWISPGNCELAEWIRRTKQWSNQRPSFGPDLIGFEGIWLRQWD